MEEVFEEFIKIREARKKKYKKSAYSNISVICQNLGHELYDVTYSEAPNVVIIKCNRCNYFILR